MTVGSKREIKKQFSPENAFFSGSYTIVTGVNKITL
jgi:hypothetical protein